jgi:hypothetical protein
VVADTTSILNSNNTFDGTYSAQFLDLFPILIKTAQLIGSVICFFLIDSLGRRPLVSFSIYLIGGVSLIYQILIIKMVIESDKLKLLFSKKIKHLFSVY